MNEMNAGIKLLDGVKIVAFTQMLLGPAGVQYLADLGADVIKIEPLGKGAMERGWAGGETYLNGESAFFLLANRNLRSLSVNLKSPEGKKLVDDLIAQADVVVENFRPGVLDRLGFGWEELSARHPALIYASASGYGRQGPYTHLPGQDLLLQAMSGLAANTGLAGHLPTPAGAPVVDQHAGTLLALGMLAALFARERTGVGQRVDVTMLEAALDLQQESLVYFLNGGKVSRPLSPIASAFHEAPYGIYQTADGHVAISLRPVALISAALGNPEGLKELLDPKLAYERRSDIHDAIAPQLREMSTDAVVELLRQHDVWCARVNDFDDLVADPVFNHLNPVVDIDHPVAGKVKLFPHPIHYSSGDFQVRSVPPGVGQDTEDILRELGYSSERIDRLFADGVVGAASRKGAPNVAV